MLINKPITDLNRFQNWLLFTLAASFVLKAIELRQFKRSLNFPASPGEILLGQIKVLKVGRHFNFDNLFLATLTVGGT